MPIENKKYPIRKYPWDAQINNELTFLITCCQPDKSKDDIDLIHSYLDTQDLEIKTMIKLANQHGILPIVYKALKKISENNAIFGTHYDTILETLKSTYTQIVQKNMLMSAELIRIMKVFEENDIKALAFKGPTLSKIAYDDITIRQFSDLDILIPTKDLHHAASLLTQNNYTIHGSIDFLNDPIWIKGTKDMTLFHERKNVVIEMHWKLFHSTFTNYTEKVNIWDKTEKIKINNINIPTLNTNMLLTYLCIHGSRHLWERIEWITDIDRVINHREIEWNEVLKLADNFQSKTMLLLGLSLSHILLGTILPTEIQNKTQTKKITYLTYLILDLIQTENPEVPTTTDVIRRKRIYASMQDNFYNKIIYWKNVFFQKNYTTILEENRPNKHTSLHSLTRPYLLVKKFFFKRDQNL